METTNTKVSLKDRILAILKLDEAGKIGAFLDKQVKLLNKSIATHKKNLEKFISEAQDGIELLDEQLDDAKQALSDAYTNVTLDDVYSNEMANSYSDIYWDSIDTCQNKIDNLEQSKQNSLDKIKKETERVEKIIFNLENKIENIS